MESEQIQQMERYNHQESQYLFHFLCFYFVTVGVWCLVFGVWCLVLPLRLLFTCQEYRLSEVQRIERTLVELHTIFTRMGEMLMEHDVTIGRSFSFLCF